MIRNLLVYFRHHLIEQIRSLKETGLSFLSLLASHSVEFGNTQIIMKRKDILSKSQYMHGLQCPKALWLNRYRPDLKPDISPVQQYLFASGREVGRLAQAYFPEGVEIVAAYNRLENAVRSTMMEARSKPKTLFEAAAMTIDGAYSRIDIMRSKGRSGAWDLVEVKSATSVKDYHLDDMAFQRYTFETAGYDIESSILMHIDNTYVRSKTIDVLKLFCLTDCTDIVKARMSDVSDDFNRLKSVLVSSTEPEVAIGKHCNAPFACDFIPYCWQSLPAYSVYSIFNGRKLDDLIARGIVDVTDIPDDTALTPRQSIEISAFKKKHIYTEADKINQFLETLVYPLYFLDYETIMPAIPLFDGTRPYQQIPFQFSLHLQKEKGGSVTHREYLYTGSGDPRPCFVAQLVNDCGDAGSVVVYNRGFEASVNSHLAEAFPDNARALSGINDRMVDLLAPFRSRAIYHPHMYGSASLKSVLPAFVPDLSYDGLSISDGQTASLMYLKIVKNEVLYEEKEKIFRDLRKYCAMDTLAEVKLLEILYQMVTE